MSRANSFVTVPVNRGNHISHETIRYDNFVLRLFKPNVRELMMSHALRGIATETGELIDAFKRHLDYGRPLDLENVREELGDLRFYMQAIQNLCDITETEILEANALKLSIRYADLKYSDEAAINRADKSE